MAPVTVRRLRKQNQRRIAGSDHHDDVAIGGLVLLHAHPGSPQRRTWKPAAIIVPISKVMRLVPVTLLSNILGSTAPSIVSYQGVWSTLGLRLRSHRNRRST